MPILLRKYSSLTFLGLMLPGLLWLLAIYMGDQAGFGKRNSDSGRSEKPCPKVAAVDLIPEAKPFIISKDECDDEQPKPQNPDVYRHGNLLVKTVRGSSIGIDEVNVYRGQRLLLHQTNLPDFMALESATRRVPKRFRRSFDDGWDFLVSDAVEPGTEPFLDLNGDRAPDLVVVKNQGNSGETCLAYSLGRRARLLATLDTIRCGVTFVDLDGDSKCEALTCDPVFYGWQTCNAESARPFVILKLGKKRFELATSLMKTPPPSKRCLETLLEKWRRECKNDPELRDKDTFYVSPKVWQDLLDLIYSGNSRVAFSLLHQFWRNGMYALNINDGGLNNRTSRKSFERVFLKELSHSTYLSELKQLNKGDAHICNLVQRQPFSRKDGE